VPPPEPAADLVGQLADARARIAELEAREAEREHALRVQAALSEIAETASAASDMFSFYAAIHAIVSKLMYAENFYIALYDAERQLINFPFYVDVRDENPPDRAAWDPMGIDEGSGVTGYLLRSGRPLHLTHEEQNRIFAAGEATLIGEQSVDWIGAPLIANGRTIGAIVAQSYRDDRVYTQQDLDLLTYVAQHIATALTRARALEETRQRNAELALVNEVGSALAQQLDFQSIIELIGERVQGIFGVDTGGIALYDAETNVISIPFALDRGARVHADPTPLVDGLGARVIRTRSPLRLGTLVEIEAYHPLLIGPEIAAAESWLGVPILAGDRVLGVITLERMQRHAFDDADERLLSTLASSMGVALENARLFDETKRLLGETEQRNAELSVINEIGAALGRQLEFDAIIEMVGERVRQIFSANSIFVALYDDGSNQVRFAYEVAEGERIHTEPIERGPGLTSRVIRERRPLRFTSAAEMAGDAIIVGGIDSESWLGVPIVAGERVIGVIALESMTLNAYSESDERLLSTVASSMGVALENARLFGETKRLLAETDARAAELAIMNSVQ
jgi:GAF domain-containing protein